MTAYRLKTASVTHPGLIRAANEDSLLVRESEGVWIVADGMGGHANGAWASGAVVHAVRQVAPGGDFDGDVAALAHALQAANTHIYSTSQTNGARMGSTAVVLHIADGRFACVWAGDSRIYLMRAGELHRLTRDHTQVQEMVDRGLLTPAEAVNHPMGHVLSRAVGVQEELELEAVSDRVEPKDVFLLCSDGLSGFVSEIEIAERLGAFGGEVACHRLLELVLSRGAPDNVTMIAVASEETTVLTFVNPVPA